MPEDNYFFVDGSCLVGDIVSLKSNKRYAGRRLSVSKCALEFVRACGPILSLDDYYFRRFVFYFVKGESRIEDNVVLPKRFLPGEAKDVQVKYCGQKLRRSSRVDKWIETHKPPAYVMDRFHRSEKAVDTQICCDALQLACSGKLDRLILYTNDSDFMPLAETLKSLGCNASLIRLTDSYVNKELCEAFDTFTVLDQSQLELVFGPPLEEEAQA